MASPKILPTFSSGSEHEHAQSITDAMQLEAEQAASKSSGKRMSKVEQDEFFSKINGEEEDDEDELGHDEDTQPTPPPPPRCFTGSPEPEKARVNKEKQRDEEPLSSSQTSFDEKSIQHRSEDIEMMRDEDAFEQFGTAPMHPVEPEASRDPPPPPTANMDTDTTNQTDTPNRKANKSRETSPPQTPKKANPMQNKQAIEPEQPHASSVYRALLPTSMTCTLAPKLDQKGIEGENVKTSQEIEARLQALRNEWNDLSEKFDDWADKGFEAQERRIRCQLRAKLMQCAEKEQETHAEQEKLIQFNDSLRQVYAAYLGLGRKQMA